MKKYPGMLAIILLSVALLFSLKNNHLSAQYTVAVVNGTLFEEIAWGYPRVSEVRFFEDDQQTFQELAEGSVDAVFTDRLAGLYQIKKGDFRKIQQAGELLHKNITMVVFNVEDITLRQAFNKELWTMISDGTYAKISAKYFGQDILDGVKLSKTPTNISQTADRSWRNIKRKRRIKFAVIPGLIPLRYYNKKQQIVGFDVDVTKTVCQRLGLRFETVAVSSDKAAKGLRNKHYHGVLGKFNVSEEQMRYFAFSDPYYISGAQLFVAKGSSIKNPAMLEDKNR